MKQERISKILAQRGICSRREAERFIEEGRIFINGKAVTEQGTKADIDADIQLDQHAQNVQDNKLTIALNKPLGYVSNLPTGNHKEALVLVTPENQHGNITIAELNDLHVIGRLDINSKGLLLFTQDGTIAKKVIGPNSNIEKEYIVRFADSVPEQAIERLKFGLKLDGQPLKRVRVKRKDEKTLTFILLEGKKRQIRRMCEIVNLTITSLKRVRIGPIQLADLPPGKWRVVAPTEWLPGDPS